MVCRIERGLVVLLRAIVLSTLSYLRCALLPLRAPFLVQQLGVFRLLPRLEPYLLYYLPLALLLLHAEGPRELVRLLQAAHREQRLATAGVTEAQLAGQ